MRYVVEYFIRFYIAAHFGTVGALQTSDLLFKVCFESSDKMYFTFYILSWLMTAARP